MKGLFDTEFNFFLSHQDELVDCYSGKTLVLRGESVIGAYDTAYDAYVASMKTLGPGKFFLQPCHPGTSAYTVTLGTPSESVKPA